MSKRKKFEGGIVIKKVERTTKPNSIMKHSESELHIIKLMKGICKDFSKYNFLKTDRYKGSLNEKNRYNIYF